MLEDDVNKAILFLGGSNLNETNALNQQNNMLKAMMIDERIFSDSYVKKSVYRLIKKRIDRAKIGVIKVHGNYSIVSGDPFGLCQSIFGYKVTGLLNSGEVYNKYWLQSGSDKLICFRAPMTCHNNVLAVSVSHSESAAYWYRYMNTCTILNCHDTAMNALNGCDFDGDLVMLTDNPVLLENHKPLPSLMCVQRKAEKTVPTEEDFIRSNIQSFGNDIGKITNRITSMYEVLSRYPKGSREYEILSYRIKCGQLFQQNAIDKAKGIICKPMPRSWFDFHSLSDIQDEAEREMNYSLLADKKPYFMRYIYPSLMKEYKDYIKNTNTVCLRRFGVTVSELKSADARSLSDEEKEFLSYYEKKMPVGTGECVMNKICVRFESEFDGFLKEKKGGNFDYSILESPESYNKAQFYAVKIIFDEYGKRLKDLKAYSFSNFSKDGDIKSEAEVLKDEFSRKCDEICPNRRVLLNILIDLCAKNDSGKRFVWDMCGDEIVEILLEKNDYKMSVPVQSENGNIYYCGKRFEIKEIVLENEYSS